MRRWILGLIVFASMNGPMWAQRTFDVVSVREYKPVNGVISMRGPGMKKEGAVQVTGYSLSNLISLGYGVRNVNGLPDWTRGMFFEIQARTDVFESLEGQKLTDAEAWEVKKEMIRTMLADRFHLVAHVDKRQADGFELRPGTKGPRLTPSLPLQTGESENAGLLQQRCDSTACEMTAGRISMKVLASVLGGQLHGIVTNNTGLPDTNQYALKLRWRSARVEDTSESDAPMLTDAVKELGLELKPVKVMEDFVWWRRWSDLRRTSADPGRLYPSFSCSFRLPSARFEQSV